MKSTIVMTNTELLNEIRKGFNEVQKETAIKRQKGWTQAFFTVLKKIGNKEGFKVYTSSVKEKISPREGGGEWLFDLCWSFEGTRKDNWKKHYKGLKLICECEWKMSDDEIIYDFQKLAVGKAELKIMIVQYKSEEQFKEFIKSCEKSVDENLITDTEKYILVGSGNGKDQYEVKWHELSIRN
ncbi:MAG: hypothetical protein D4R68_01250 [Ignavibacteriales bacterium]|nr:MAG: hypothetical protein D4R68_01250 [Ignavibacteriales bacterium]